MKITGQTNSAILPTVTKPAGGASSPAADPQPAAGVSGARDRGSDSVQISDAGRTLASDGAAGASSVGTAGASSLSPERVAELRKRVLEGAYNSAAVVDQVARRILDRGDA